MRFSKRNNSAFTLMELLVAMTILMLLLFLLSELFQSTSSAVTRSVQNSKVIAATRSIGEQMQADFDAMVGPNSTGGGYIVIIQHKLTGIPMLDPKTLAEVPNPVSVRSDQIVFIRDAAGLESMTPRGPGSYRSTIAGTTGQFAKVSYGHVQRTNRNGTIPGNTATFRLGGSSSGLDRIASDWVLGRQAMLLNPSGLTASDTYASSAFYNSAVANAGSGAPATPLAYMGLTDVTAQDYGPASTAGTLLYNLLGDTSLAEPAQTANYLNTAYRLDDFKLHANPSPDASSTSFASWAIAQTHPILAQGCSEFIVDFACDMNGNGLIDTQVLRGGADTSGPIWWYDAIEQVFSPGWLTQPSPSNTKPYRINGFNYEVLVFRVNDATSFDSAGGTVGTAGTAHSYWPYLIRVRYRLHDTRGRLTSNNPAALTDGLDNDGDGSTDEVGEDQISGRWFEHIFRVPRP